MSDLISRQAAIDVLGEKPFAGTGDEYDYEPVGYVRGVILCKYCKFNDLPETCGNSYCTKGMNITNPYGYCSEGERRTDEQ